MAYYDRLKEARCKKDMTQKELAEIIGIGKSTLTNYENGKREPSVKILNQMMDILQVDANFIFQDEMNMDSDPDVATPSEMEVIKKYRQLDPRGQATVLDTLNRELSYISDMAEQKQKDNERKLQEAGQMIGDIIRNAKESDFIKTK